MKSRPVTMVRVYLTEGEGRLPALMAKLHDEEKVAGVTVFRGVSGFGRSGVVHSTHLLDLASRLPVVVEFFDSPEKVAAILAHLEDLIEPGHLIHWEAFVNDDGD